MWLLRDDILYPLEGVKVRKLKIKEEWFLIGEKDQIVEFKIELSEKELSALWKKLIKGLKKQKVLVS